MAVGVLFDGVEYTAGFGVTNVENPLPVTPTTLYQIGSITKTFLGTLVMRLIEMGERAQKAGAEMRWAARAAWVIRAA